MELVSILVGLAGAGATIVAAYIQAHHSSLHPALEMTTLNREMSVSVSSPSSGKPEGVRVSLEVKHPREGNTDGQLSSTARPAFMDDLGCEPVEGELLLFLRKGRFKAGYPSSP